MTETVESNASNVSADTTASTVEIYDGTGWQPVCEWDGLVPGRGVAVLVGDQQVAVFRDRAGEVYAVGNRDPFSGAHVLSRGILGSRDGAPVVASPMYKQAFCLRTGACLDEPLAPDGSEAAVRVWPVRRGVAPEPVVSYEPPEPVAGAPRRAGHAGHAGHARHDIADWRPEDPVFWKETGARTARRNLLFSVLSEHIGFSVWSLWSVLVLFLGPEYGIDPAGKFLLTALPTALGAVLRLPYTVAVAAFGGRNWTVISALLLLVPTVLAGVLLEPGVSYGTLLAVACAAGVGGGNFASSMANINAFYPQRLKGWALGVNAGGGNLGVAAVQLLGLLVLATAGSGNPRLLPLLYLPLIALAALGAALRMDNLTGLRNHKRALREICREPHTWVMSVLYIGTFGSFIGFGFAFGQVLQVQFHGDFDTPVKAAGLTFLGPLLGSLVRPVGGLLADRWGGARVTLVNYGAMAAGAVTVLVASREGSLPLFVTGFVALFVFSGIGNGSTYKMIPAIFRARARTAVEAHGADPAAAEETSRRRASALIGVAGAVGAFGGVLVNLAFRQSFLGSHNGDAAYLAFLATYALCAALTWAVYLRPGRGPVGV
ncbi:nitrite reductase small subunit NirD [Streptomyces sp. NRRL B-1677]|uniref:Nitrite reductase (NAD(P)H) small subunit n=1 Tax=Streptomyces klenkii TaxID=1420899 RepID=A0A3B0BNN9_9ACTN|nr:nitrite reductase small subunit NirD [Streptomyces sp. NRRL B-1677]RKN74572.1 nitrite reductase (NAD(P)H) small subunit [Streptomyces klenkii]